MSAAQTLRDAFPRPSATAADTKPPILFLAEGDPETWNSFSGCSRAAVHAMRAHGRDVRTADADLYGASNALAKLLTFWPSRERWVHRYHAGAPGFRLRTMRARVAVSGFPDGAPVIQAGATFDSCTGLHPLFILADANAAFAARGGPYGPLSHLTSRELGALIRRERHVYQKATAIFTFTEGLRRSFIEDFAVDPARVVTTFAGPNLPYVPSEEDLRTPKATHPTILFIGRQFDRKGGPTLVEAFARVRAAIPQARLVIAGCEPRLAYAEGIEVLGLVRRDDPTARGLRHLFLTSDVYCMPSRYEPFGMTFSEAMFHGLPCVGPARYMSEIIDHDRTGWLLSKDDPAELASILIDALSDRERLREMGRAGRAKARDFFTWSRATSLMLDVIDRATGST